MLKSVVSPTTHLCNGAQLIEEHMQTPNLGVQAFDVGLSLSHPFVDSLGSLHSLLHLRIHAVDEGLQDFRDALRYKDALVFVES